jgi:hypothetical protein
MADVKGDLSVKGHLDVRENAVFFKGVDSPYFEIIDQKNPAILGGGSAAGIWTARDLNVVIHNDIASEVNLSSVAGDGADFTLPAGEYHIDASAPAFNVGNHTTRLADITSFPSNTAPTVVLGTAEWTMHVDGIPAGEESVQTRSHVVGRFTLTGSRKLELQHRLQYTDTVEGFGAGSGFYTVDNVYSVVRIWQIRDDS